MAQSSNFDRLRALIPQIDWDKVIRQANNVDDVDAAIADAHAIANLAAKSSDNLTTLLYIAAIAMHTDPTIAAGLVAISAGMEVPLVGTSH